ncbi:MAG: hypothetical protein KAS73_08355 [Candidatus Sabulitectum sp.]|nr:hypothetical protein [Candidatus Sabulitectum sp.]
MEQWLSPLVFTQTLVRVAVVWIAFYGSGRLLRKILRIDSIFPLLPNELVGLLTFAALTIPLSLAGIMTRSICQILLFLPAIPGSLFIYSSVRKRLLSAKLSLISILSVLFLVFVLFLNFTHASMPNLAFDDPLVTYAVQPDRWLNAGKIFWLDETVFSGFPMLYEMTAVWPASISSNRMNQLSVLQVFQMSMLVLAVFRGLSIMKVKREIRLPVSTVVLLTTALYLWCAIAKTDTLAILLCTLALASAIRQKDESFTGKPFSSWFFMGLALATKQSALVVFIPFSIYSLLPFIKYSFKQKAIALAVLLLIPGVFGVRTMLKTGSPTYPFYPVTYTLNSDWELSSTEERLTVQSRDSSFYNQMDFPLYKHIGIYFAFMEGNILLLLLGLAVSAAKKNWKGILISLPLIAYFAVSLKLFWPPWWGAKYTILIYPFIAILGAKLLQDFRYHRIATYIVMILAFIVPGFFAVAGNAMPFSYRITVAGSVLHGEWDTNSNYQRLINTPTAEGASNMWANAALPPGTVIFSLNEEKRYFFDGTIIVGERHPLTQSIYQHNTLEEELEALDLLGVDYVTFYREDPAILQQENKLAILDHIGIGDILEPVIIIKGGYLLCRYNR